MKILFTTSILEHPPAGGPFLRIENSIKALSQIADLHIISRVQKKDIGGNQAENFYKQYSKAFMYSPSATPGFLKRWFNKKSWFKKKLYQIQDLFHSWFPEKRKKSIQKIISSFDAKFIYDYAKKHNITIIWFGYGCNGKEHWTIREVKKLDPSLKIICNTDSVMSRFLLRGLPFIKNKKRYKEIKKEGEEKIKDEKEWVTTCEMTTAVSNVDLHYYQNLAPDPKKVRRFSNVIDMQTYESKQPPPKNYKKPCMYLAGFFGPDSPMEQAARWVVNDILPLVKKEIPKIHLYIVGKGSDTTLSDIKDANITVTGLVESVLPYLTNADVALVPLKFESGTRFKILEAGACGIPIVSTTLGAEGLEIKHNKNILIADNSIDFAQAIIKIIKNEKLAQTIGENCKKFVQNRYSIESLKKEGEAILNYLTISSKRKPYEANREKIS